MDDSEKRKEMLKAMRMEAAAQNDDSTSLEASTDTTHLSNPLAESSTQQDSYETPRFDYYTNPTSAYSSFQKNKTPKQQYMSSPSCQISSPLPQFPLSAPGSLGSSDYQANTNHGGFQAPLYDADNMYTEARDMTHISPSHRGPPAAWSNNFRPPPLNHLPPPPYPFPHSQERPDMRNHLPPPPYPFPHSQERPDMGNNSFGGRGGYNNMGRGGYNNMRPQYSHYGQQNSNWVGNTYSGSGRGRGGGRGMNRNFGRDGGRRPMGQGAERFYSNSMTEDPWKDLKPLLWKSCSDASSSNVMGQSWLPSSIAPKKPAVIPEASHKPSNKQQSLAEFLAESVDEATCNESSN